MSILANEQIQLPSQSYSSLDSENPLTMKLGEDHIEAVRKQIEYYFSKENLQNDPYLESQMDANRSVPLSTIMRFAKLKALTQDENIVRQSLQSSTVVTLVNDRIRLNVKTGGRSTIILREIPPDATEDEIREIFNFEGCRPVQSMRPDIENTWFVVMESEDDVKDTVLDLQLKKRQFRGEKVKVRVKTESSIRSFYPIQPSPPIAPVLYQPFPGYAAMGMPVDMRSYPYIPTAPVPAIPIAPTSSSIGIDYDQNVNESIIPKSGLDKSTVENHAPNGYNTNDRRNGQRQGNGKDKDNRDGKKTQGTMTGNMNQNGAKRDNTNGRKGSRSDGRRDGQSNKLGPAIEIDSVNFPPLGVNQLGEESPIPTPGYKTEVVKYSFDDMINIVKNVKDATLPEDVHPNEHPYAMTTSPNLDLLQRQRTFSIDETREQLQQGHLVQRIAVTSGEVDYGNMMYGDGYTMNNNVINDSASKLAVSVPLFDSSNTSLTVNSSPIVNTNSTINTNTIVNTNVSNPSISKTPVSSWAALVKSSSSSDQLNKQGIVSTSQLPSRQPIDSKKATSTVPASPNKKSSSVPSSPAKSPETNLNNGSQSVSKESSKVKKPSQLFSHDDTTVSNGHNHSQSHHSPDNSITETSKMSKEDMATTTTTTIITTSHTSTDNGQTAIKPLSNWGGKPTFANILKQQVESASSSILKPSVITDNSITAEPILENVTSNTMTTNGTNGHYHPNHSNHHSHHDDSNGQKKKSDKNGDRKSDKKGRNGSNSNVNFTNGHSGHGGSSSDNWRRRESKAETSDDPSAK